ncbi:MAG: hypothetical protein NWF01_00930 [Candidatus Bathyarchaeota archaeon]|nr:hypothetical protein [Candidatus Bathyarchaeota archaeon]
MQFFHIRNDDSKNWYNYLVVQLGKEEFSALKAKQNMQAADFASCAVIRDGAPFVVFGYGGGICLSEAFESGQTLADKLMAGDVVTVILTDKPQEELFVFSGHSLSLNFNLEEVVVHSFTYSKEMEQIYEFYKHYTKVKGIDNKIPVKTKRGLFK